jgi:3-oxoacyl-[acyl-carrier-protein] synthase III
MSHSTGTLKFSNATVTGIVTYVGDQVVDFMGCAGDMGLSHKEALRIKKVMGLSQRHIVSGDKTTSDLCFEAARDLLSGMRVKPTDVDALIFVSQTPDYKTPASAIGLQDRLGLSIRSMCFDVSLGCSGFVYGLSIAFSLVESGFQKVLLCLGDVASKIVDPKDHVVAPIMGDAGSCALIERKKSDSIFHLYSDGSGADALIIPNSGVRRDPKYKGMLPVLKMSGSDVFSFSIKRVPPMISEIMLSAGKTEKDIDYLLMHQPNSYMLKQISKRLEIENSKVPSSTQSVYGNQNSASIPGTISGFLAQEFGLKSLKSLICGFGVGLSWGAAFIETDRIFCPEVKIVEK